MSVAISTPAAEKIRYHGLDALRAWAMSMGVVLHAAWIMTPGNSGAPKTDASASPWMDYLAGGIHMFRMQLFFVLAGFFACLLVHKRGSMKFAVNRILRIGIPLVLFWLVLRPTMTWQFYQAKIQSGEIVGSATAWDIVVSDYTNMTAETVFTMHLWFIYYLFLTYILFLVGRAAVAVLDPGARLRNGLASAFGHVLSRSWSILPLAILTGSFMVPMEDFYGIQIDAFSLYPLWSGLLCYVAFFTVGWFVHRNADRLGDILGGWKWQLTVGVLLTVPNYFFSLYANQNGYQTPQYPALTVSDIHYDSSTSEPVYPLLRQRLLEADEGTVPAKVWHMLPEPNRRFVEENQTASENQIAGLLAAINKEVLSNAELAEKRRTLDSTEAAKSETATTGSGDNDAGIASSSALVQLQNRKLLESAFAGIIWSEDIERPYYYPIRIGFSFLYSIGTWALIFGCIGFAQHFFDNHSRFWRYFSDASYWVYLMHLLVQSQILLWFGDQAWHWTWKFSLYVFGSLAVLVPTYHLLVRSTWLGWLLNGRVFPIWGENPTTEKFGSLLSPGKADADSPTPQFR